jgi:O-antigen/teichoic acid export membrane protein
VTSQSATSAEGGARGTRVSALSRPTTIMVALTSIASALNYASNLIFSRILAPESYGDLTALLALAVVAAVPTGAAQTVVADRIATHLAAGRRDSARYLMRHAVAHVAAISLGLGFIYSLCLPFMIPALSLQAVGPAFALLPLVVLSFFMPTVFGILQGWDRFVLLGGVMVLIAGSRLLFGVPWAMLDGGGAGGPLAGQAIGNLAAIGLVWWALRQEWLPAGSGAATTGARRTVDRRAVAASGAFIAFALLSNLDVVLAKLFLSSREAGYYGALATIGKIVIFLPAAVALVMVPAAARARLERGTSAHVLRTAALVVVVATAVAAVPAALIPGTALRLMFGAAYEAAADGVLPIVCAGAALALLYLLVVYTVAIQDRRWVVLLAGAVLAQVAAIAAFHDDVVQVATAQAVVCVGTLVVNEVVFHPLLRTRKLLHEEA